MSFYLEEAEMSAGNRSVRLQGTFNETLIELKVAADGSLQAREINLPQDQQNL